MYWRGGAMSYRGSRYAYESSRGLRTALMFLGVLVVLILLSLVSGGFVVYFNHVAIAFASKPILVLVLEMLMIVIAGAPIAFLLIRARPGFLPGLFLTLFIVFAIYALANTIALVLYLFIAVVIVIAIGISITRRDVHVPRATVKMVKLCILLAPLLITYVLLVLYTPIASSQHINFIEVSSPVEVNALKRFIPLMTAYAYAVDRLQIPTHRVYAGDSYVYFANGKSVYNWVIEPQGFWNEVTKPPKGFIFVYGDVFPPQVEIIQRDIAWGLHNARFYGLFFDTLYRQIVLRVGIQYKPLLENNIEVVYNGELLILVPVQGWRRGLLYSVPVLHGYAVVHENGSIEFVRAEDALRDPRFRSIPVVPEVIARQWAELRRYHVGFVDFYFYRNTYAIRDVGTNPQPYLSVDRDRMWWVFVAEPPGEAYSAKYIMYVDPLSLEPAIYIYTLPTPMIGISKVESYIKQHFPMYDWSQFTVEEPTPLLINNTLYWKVSVVTRDYRGLVLVALVNAKTGTVTSIDVTKWGFQVKGVLTADTLLTLVTKQAPAEEVSESIEARIKHLEQLIQQLRDVLNQLEKELSELKKQLGQQQ